MVIKKAEYVISSPTVEGCPKPDRPEYAFIGRSNVGKSSLINMITNHQKLAKTSVSPGKTQNINHFAIDSAGNPKNTTVRWYLVDLPGYGYAKIAQTTRKAWTKMIEDYLRKRPNLLNVFVLVDSRHSPQKIDIEFVNELGSWQVPFTIVFTKADKEKPGAVQRHVKEFFTEMLKTWQFLPQSFITSANTKQGRAEILQFIDEQNTAAATNAEQNKI